ncbi:MAG TPA: hypothetical protein VK978_03355 [Candidatus Saccharimonadales bacterium]|nr:hypothetical protein [Candidatus Saccharimonadales bacterium]
MSQNGSRPIDPRDVPPGFQGPLPRSYETSTSEPSEGRWPHWLYRIWKTIPRPHLRSRNHADTPEAVEHADEPPTQHHYDDWGDPDDDDYADLEDRYRDDEDDEAVGLEHLDDQEKMPASEQVRYVIGTIAAALALAMLLMIWVLLVFRTPFFWWVDLFISVVLVALPVLYAYRTRQEIDRLTPLPEQLHMEADEGAIKIGYRTSLRVRRRIKLNETNPELSSTYIYQMRRFHWMLLVRKTWLPVLCTVGVVILLFWPGGIAPALPWWLAVALPSSGALWTYVTALAWLNRFYVRTDKQVLIVVQPPAWLWFLNDSSPFLNHWDIRQAIHRQQSWLGEFFHYGLGDITAAAGIDAMEFKPISYLPDHDKEMERINEQAEVARGSSDTP